jgi:hypothetical protein
MAENAVVESARATFEQPAWVQARTRAADVLTPKVQKPKDKVKVKAPESLLGEEGSDAVLEPAVSKKPRKPGRLTPTDLGKDSDARDPGSFGAGKPKSTGRTKFDGNGRSFAEIDLGSDSESNDNATTKKWDRVYRG